jgi:hypothetical protein
VACEWGGYAHTPWHDVIERWKNRKVSMEIWSKSSENESNDIMIKEGETKECNFIVA